jgi:hypothetical protein
MHGLLFWVIKIDGADGEVVNVNWNKAIITSPKLGRDEAKIEFY